MKADLIVAGAGPAGLFAAIQAAKNHQNKDIIILEKNSSAGKKLLISGSGQCNLTHAGDISLFFDHYGENYTFLMGPLYTFDNQQLMRFFENRGIEFRKARGGKIFPKSNKASDILNVLLKEAKSKNIKIIYDTTIKKVNYTNKLFEIKSENEVYKSKYFLLATGGKSFPKTGSTGDGFKIAKNLGHKIVDPRPALAPVVIKNYQFKMLSGISLRNKRISLWRDGQLLKSWSDDLLLTHRGLSGPGIINYSRYMKKGDLLKIKLLKYSQEELEKNLLKRIEREGRLNLLNLLIKYPLAQRLIEKILEIANIDGSQNAAHLRKDQRREITELFSSLEFEIKSLADFNQSMVTKGGIDLNEINPQTMESKIINNLFAAGEILDIDGDTGGYNLQAAFSTSYLAGNSIFE
ncbi:NAD(FAD)-utilizing dehydrogenases [Halanaerobium saccharolyticum subsp. saccharolyticum DSM 6643]|uniref:NAD(FAD)-utilizing dehydrogenases n=1 Tax=Halanaerobium saccharolyticum subsp. saccharolyticum DSM 6643 TaxID=1293054 RepID=M5DX34_9FIRM|nr:NAD(P)/FAD-dependent oxidoreductase [Halanaerobium saccharolyticum]CCU77937.1 NAD(FAD)-utilizing dehydrogenases [Halanaerobium saccharolyticum subsp. saccharolyticum DSM 6643]